MREMPDISYNAADHRRRARRADAPTDRRGDVFFRFGGTSADRRSGRVSSALADQMAGGRIGGINQTLYKLGKGGSASSYFHDITDGSTNSRAGVGACSGDPDHGTTIGGSGRAGDDGDGMGHADREHARSARSRSPARADSRQTEGRESRPPGDPSHLTSQRDGTI